MANRDEKPLTARDLRALGEFVPPCVPDDAPTRVSKQTRANGDAEVRVDYVDQRPIDSIRISVRFVDPAIEDAC